MHRPHQLFLATIALLGSTAPACFERGLARTSWQEEDRASSILERMREAYAACDTYRDEGQATTVFERDGRKRTVVKPFETAFSRPDHFRFEYRARRGELEWDRYIIWTGGTGVEGKVQTYWTVTGEQRDWDELGQAIGAAHGVSGTVSKRVPDLLRSQPGWQGFSVEGYSLDGEEEIEGHPCWRIIAHRPGRVWPIAPRPEVKNGAKSVRYGPATYWIDQETHLLRKVHTTKEFDRFWTGTTIVYQPVIGEPIPSSAFAFDPTK